MEGKIRREPKIDELQPEINQKFDEIMELLRALKSEMDVKPTSGSSYMEEKNNNRILLVTIDHMFYPITVEALHQVFSLYGLVEKIDTLDNSNGFHASIQYQSSSCAIQATSSLQGRYIYDGCCQMKIQFSNLSELQVNDNNHEFALDAYNLNSGISMVDSIVTNDALPIDISKSHYDPSYWKGFVQSTQEVNDLSKEQVYTKNNERCEKKVQQLKLGDEVNDVAILYRDQIKSDYVLHDKEFDGIQKEIDMSEHQSNQHQARIEDSVLCITRRQNQFVFAKSVLSWELVQQSTSEEPEWKARPPPKPIFPLGNSSCPDLKKRWLWDPGGPFKFGFNEILLISSMHTQIVQAIAVCEVAEKAIADRHKAQVHNQGCLQNGKARAAFPVFRRMRSSHIEADDATMVGVIPACSNLAALLLEKCSHGYGAICDKLENREIRVGSKVLVMPSGDIAVVRIIKHDSCNCNSARVEENIVVILQIVNAGCVLTGGALYLCLEHRKAGNEVPIPFMMASDGIKKRSIVQQFKSILLDPLTMFDFSNGWSFDWSCTFFPNVLCRFVVLNKANWCGEFNTSP